MNLDAALRCSADSDCDDTLFCNGAERCDPEDPVASPLGCVAGSPCLSLCDERMDLCTDDCVDADGDGFMDVACGGSDCDDADAERSPGVTEICNTIDEDCDPDTIGDLDADMDEHVAAECCNGDTCGDDCDDENPGAHADEAESCDGFDNDCDGMVDEGVLVESWPDLDGDRFGDSAATPDMVCDRPSEAASRGGDCDDSDGTINPGAIDLCNDLDDDCDGTIDEDGDAICATAIGGDTVARCVVDPEGGPSRCYGIDCSGGGAVCGAGGQNLCNQDVCDSEIACGECSRTCERSCDDGQCVLAITEVTLTGSVADVVSAAPISGATIEARARCASTDVLTTDASGDFSGIMQPRDSYQTTAAGYLRAIRPQAFDPDAGDLDALLGEADLASILADPDVGASWDRELGIVLASAGAAADIDVDGPHGERIHVDESGDASPYTGQSGGFVLILNVLPGRWNVHADSDPLCDSRCDTPIRVVGGATSFAGFPASCFPTMCVIGD